MRSRVAARFDVGGEVEEIAGDFSEGHHHLEERVQCLQDELGFRAEQRFLDDGVEEDIVRGDDFVQIRVRLKLLLKFHPRRLQDFKHDVILKVGYEVVHLAAERVAVSNHLHQNFPGRADFSRLG